MRDLRERSEQRNGCRRGPGRAMVYARSPAAAQPEALSKRDGPEPGADAQSSAPSVRPGPGVRCPAGITGGLVQGSQPACRGELRLQRDDIIRQALLGDAAEGGDPSPAAVEKLIACRPAPWPRRPGRFRGETPTSWPTAPAAGVRHHHPGALDDAGRSAVPQFSGIDITPIAWRSNAPGPPASNRAGNGATHEAILNNTPTSLRSSTCSIRFIYAVTTCTEV